MSIERIVWGLKKPDEFGLFHDSRSDVKTLAKCIILLRDKVNELIDKNNDLEKEINQLKNNQIK